MRITLRDHINLVLKVYLTFGKMSLRTMIRTFIKPVESTRYNEFSYILKFLKSIGGLKNSNILDVSSPYSLAYILATGNNKVIKTDINDFERRYIKDSPHLVFKKEDATELSFEDEMFDFVYSVSVIEHIYEKYQNAVEEMIRVTKPGGLIYLSTPVSREHKEEWYEEDIYSDQYKSDNKVFFQYRFSQEDIETLLSSLNNVEIVRKDIFWEKKDGMYDKFIKNLSIRIKPSPLEFLRNSFYNMWIGSGILNSDSGSFEHAKSFGNVSIIIKKNKS